MNYQENMYSSFQAICNMDIDTKKKIGMMTILFSIEPNNWRVMGISENALKRFNEHKFKRVSGMGINRSHLKRRFDSYNDLMEKEAKGDFKNDFSKWWEHYFKNDITYLTTSSENMSSKHSNIIKIKNYDFQLFKSKGYAWKHGEVEIHLLKKMFNKHCST